MIRAGGRTGDGRPLLLLGLSGENWARLLAGEPIALDARPIVGVDCQVVIVGGRTEDAITAELERVGLLDASVPQERDPRLGLRTPRSERRLGLVDPERDGLL